MTNTLYTSGWAAILALAAASFQPAQAMTPDKPVLEPSSPWQVDYAQNECRLLRDFGTGKDAITLRLARASGFDSFDMIIAGAPIPRLPAKLDISFGLEPQNKTQTVEGYSMAVPGQPFRFIRWYDASPEFLPAVTNTQIVTVRHADRFDIAMRWTDGKAALKALEACHFDLLKSWGIDVAVLNTAKVRAQPIGNPARWVTNDDYPSTAQSAEQEGTVIFQLEIDAGGSVANCAIVKSSLVPALDRATCPLLRKRAQFAPALDKDNQPMVGFYVNRVRWQIPR